MKHTLTFLITLLLAPAVVGTAAIQEGEMAGYLFGPTEKVPEEFNADYHYLGCAKTFALMGKAFADADLKMLESRR